MSLQDLLDKVKSLETRSLKQEKQILDLRVQLLKGQIYDIQQRYKHPLARKKFNLGDIVKLSPLGISSSIYRDPETVRGKVVGFSSKRDPLFMWVRLEKRKEKRFLYCHLWEVVC